MIRRACHAACVEKTNFSFADFPQAFLTDVAVIEPMVTQTANDFANVPSLERGSGGVGRPCTLSSSSLGFRSSSSLSSSSCLDSCASSSSCAVFTFSARQDAGNECFGSKFKAGLKEAPSLFACEAYGI